MGFQVKTIHLNICYPECSTFKNPSYLLTRNLLTPHIMKKFTFLIPVMATLSCLGTLSAQADRQVVRSEQYGDGYSYGIDTKVSTTENVVGTEGRTLSSSTVTNTDGNRVTARTLFTYEADGLSSAVINQGLMQKNVSESENLEFVWTNKSRTFNFFDANGRTIRTYGTNWNTSKNSWQITNTAGWEYDYNDKGQVTGARYWRMYNAAQNPTYTYTLTYDSDGNLTQMVREGAYATSPLKVDLTWENGRLIRQDQKKCKELDADGHPLWLDDCNYIFNYNPDGLLTDYVKYTYTITDKTTGAGEFNPTNKNVIEYGGNGTFARYSTGLGETGISYGVTTTDFDTTTTYSVSYLTGKDDWGSANRKYVNHWYDLNSADALTATELTVQAGTGVAEALVSCKVPESDKNITAILYRDGEPVKVLDLADAGDAFDTTTRTLKITDKATVGEHSYTVVLKTTDAAGIEFYGKAPLYIVFNIEANLPAISNFKVVKAYKKETTSTGLDENGKTVTQTIVNNMVTVSWDPISEADAETYGFKQYEFYNGIYSIAYAKNDRYTTRQFNIDLEDHAESDIWITAVYDAGTVTSEKLHVVVDDYIEKEPVIVWGIADVNSDLCMVKGDLNDSQKAPEVLVDLYEENNMMISQLCGGTSVGDYYYATMYDDNGKSKFYSLNFTTNEVVPVHTYTWGDLGYDASNFAYDDKNDKLYATVEAYDDVENETFCHLLTIDYNTGEATDLGVLGVTPDLMTAYDGVLYAGIKTGDWSAGYKLTVNTIDPVTLTATTLADTEPFETTSNMMRAAACKDGKIHITIGTRYTVVDIATGAVTSMPTLKKGYYAITFTQSNKSAEAAQEPQSDSNNRKLYRKANYGDAMGAFADDETSETLYYYNRSGQIAREVTNSRTTDGNKVTDDWRKDNFIQYEYNDQNKLTEVNIYQYGQYNLDMEGRELRSTTDYEYNDAGQLVTETETLPAFFEGMPDTKNITTYTYNEEGNMATKTVANNGNVNETYEYSYQDGRIDTVNVESYGQKSVQMYTYNADGNLEQIMTAVLDQTGEPQLSSTRLWEYFEGTDIVKTELEYYSFDEHGMPTGGTQTVYEAVNGDTNILKAKTQSMWNGEWMDEAGSEKVLYYADFEGMASQTATELTVTPDEGINEALLKFPLPEAFMISMTPARLNVVRNGEVIKTLAADDILQLIDPESMAYDVIWKDQFVPNGDNEYFVQVQFSQSGEIDPWAAEVAAPEWIGYNISNIAGIQFDTELPKVTNLNVVSFKQVLVDDYNNIVTMGGHKAYEVTLSWTNPDKMADYGFISNRLYEHPFAYCLRNIEDAAVNTTTMIIPETGTSDAYIRSVYKLGFIDSEVLAIDLLATGVQNINGGNATLVGGILNLVSAADVQVFDVQGRKLMEVHNSDSVDLRTFKGVVIIVINSENKKTIKTVL